MYHHPVTQASLKDLTKIGLDILPTGQGTLACGEVGEGKLLDPEKILYHLEKIISKMDFQTDSQNSKHFQVNSQANSQASSPVSFQAGSPLSSQVGSQVKSKVSFQKLKGAKVPKASKASKGLKEELGRVEV